MNRNQFFATVRMTKAEIEVVQMDEKGYALTATVQHPDEDPEYITLMYKDEPRYFKSINSVIELLRSKDENDKLVYNLFNKKGELCLKIRMTATPIAQATRAAK